MAEEIFTLLDYIDDLSRKDPKSLLERYGKINEELGELSKAVLPYSNVAGTLHRFATRTQIIEEVVDTILCVYSVGKSVDMTYDEFTAMMWKKAKKWEGLQTSEFGIKDPNKIPFEVHITIKEAIPDIFKRNCERHGVKPILLDLHTAGGMVKDMQTSSVHIGTNRTVYEYASDIAYNLELDGYEVVRTKIETVPWHPAAPQTSPQKMPENCYFESHIAILTTESNIESLKNVCEFLGVRLSRNVFKKLETDMIKIMATYRDYVLPRDKFIQKLEQITTALSDFNFTYEEPIVEFSIYDTNVSHDAAWIRS